jgi:hypothetical protein
VNYALEVLRADCRLDAAKRRREKFEAEQAYLNSLTWTDRELEQFHARIIGIENRFELWKLWPSRFALLVWEAVLDVRPHPSHSA